MQIADKTVGSHFFLLKHDNNEASNEAYILDEIWDSHMFDNKIMFSDKRAVKFRRRDAKPGLR